MIYQMVAMKDGSCRESFTTSCFFPSSFSWKRQQSQMQLRTRLSSDDSSCLSLLLEVARPLPQSQMLLVVAIGARERNGLQHLSAHKLVHASFPPFSFSFPDGVAVT